ncbi:MAG: nitroreductase family deazaflavin-dependent oxidoreductase [Candidatus Xenobia bacterium]
MHLPYALRRINRVFTNRLLGPLAWWLPPLAVILHQGRKSGRPYRSPIVAFHQGKLWVVPLTYGRDVDWARNIQAANGCELVQLGRRHRLTNPRLVDGADAAPHLPWLPRRLLIPGNLPGYVLLDVA